jgi:hypothetical protein
VVSIIVLSIAVIRLTRYARRALAEQLANEEASDTGLPLLLSDKEGGSPAQDGHLGNAAGGQYSPSQSTQETLETS